MRLSEDWTQQENISVNLKTDNRKYQMKTKGEKQAIQNLWIV